MTFIIVLLAISLSLINCTTNSKSNNQTCINDFILNYENDSFKIHIKEVSKINLASFTNRISKGPNVGINAECLSMKELVGLLKCVDTSLIIISDKELDSRYFNVLIEQDLIKDSQDSIILIKILNKYGLDIKIDTFIVDTTIVSINDKSKFLKFSNKVVRDTITSEITLSQDSIGFKNTKLESIAANLSKIYNKTFILKTNVPQRIDYKFKRNDWELTKLKLESELGLRFDKHLTQKEKYNIRTKANKGS
jgi:hypothetical protein